MPCVKNEGNMVKYSFIIPSRGDRPLALGHALDGIMEALNHAKLQENTIEILVGFDGIQGERVRNYSCVRYYDLPANNNYGNALRHALLKAARGQRVIFHDDDNKLTPEALTIYEKHQDVDMLIARIDVSLAHPVPYIPIEEAQKPLVRPCNIDPLCLCLSRELVLIRCGGWKGDKYEADYENILRYSRRAHSMRAIEDVVGIYDMGRGMDNGGLNFRQKALKEKQSS